MDCKGFQKEVLLEEGTTPLISLGSYGPSDRSLADGTTDGHDRQSYQLSPHRPRPYHPPLRHPLQYPQLNEFSYEEELHNPIYRYNDFEDNYEDE